jgi:hypothetical protein
MTDVDSMWYCPTCEAWVGTEIETCFVCETERPLLPVTSDAVPVDYAPNVTTTHRVRAKLSKASRIVSER